MVRTEEELEMMVAYIEEVYPPGSDSRITNPLKGYYLGVLAGLKVALGDYASFTEIDLEDFMRAIFSRGCG